MHFELYSSMQFISWMVSFTSTQFHVNTPNKGVFIITLVGGRVFENSWRETFLPPPPIGRTGNFFGPPLIIVETFLNPPPSTYCTVWNALFSLSYKTQLQMWNKRTIQFVVHQPTSRNVSLSCACWGPGRWITQHGYT